MKTSESIVNISKALLEAQKKIGAAKKGATNPFFHSKYASLGSVMEACKEILNENGITVLQPVETDELGVYVETVLMHISGEYLSSKMALAIKDRDNPQAQGSAISYARRYGLQSMVFIPAEDDDAEKATKVAQVKTVNPVDAKPAEEAGWMKPNVALCPLHPKQVVIKLSTGEVGHRWEKENGQVLVCTGKGFNLVS